MLAAAGSALSAGVGSLGSRGTGGTGRSGLGGAGRAGLTGRADGKGGTMVSRGRSLTMVFGVGFGVGTSTVVFAGKSSERGFTGR